MSSSKYVKSVFNQEWTDPRVNPNFSTWIQEVANNPFSAYCKLCSKTFSLSNMGKQAVSSHAQSAKHKKITASKSSSLFTLIAKKCTSTSEVRDLAGNNGESSSFANGNSTNVGTSTSRGKTLSNFIAQENVFKAEILWAMKLVVSHSKFNAFNDVAEIFSCMFNDSEIAKKCTLGRAKMSYLVCYGLAPFFHLSVQKAVEPIKYVLCFDEALNCISQKCQIDLIIRYWCESSNRVVSRYWNSVFLRRATAEELLEKFKEAISDLDFKLLLQISMDGPNVNIKFLKYFKAEISSTYDSDILELGTCGLHIVHGAFQFGHKSTNWKLDIVLGSLFRLFKDSPSRRANFIEVTASTEFPLKFCAVRWVENVRVCERALQTFDNVKKYLEMHKKSLPGTFTSDAVIDACNDKLILVKIAFFSYIASILEPFLKKFQTSKPMVPFLYSNIFGLLRQLLKIIAKSYVIDKTKSLEKLTSIDMDDPNNFCLRKKVDIGIVTSRYLHISGASESQKIDFLSVCFNFVKSTIKKIVERTSKNFAVLRAASSINPILLQSNIVLCGKRMTDLLELLYSKGKISATCAERAKIQFGVFLEKIGNEYKEKLSSFKEEMRLDEFYFTMLNTKEFSDIWEVVKLILILSHGNAAVESGFSINKDMLVENLNEDSLIGLRTVYDAVKFHGGVVNVQITKELLQHAKFARVRYHEALEKKKEQVVKEKEKQNEKHKFSQQIKLLQNKKRKLLDDKSAQIAEIDVQISELSKKTT